MTSETAASGLGPGAATGTGTAVSFSNDAGRRLSGIYDAPAGEAHTVALFAHCFTCSTRTRATARVCRALTSHGIAVLRFDFAGLGESEGDFENQSFTSSVGDLLAAAAWLRANHRAPALLIGHSLGGAAVLAAAARIPESRAVATIGAPADTDHARSLFADAVDRIARDGRADVTLGGRTLTIGRDLVADLAAQPQQRRIATLGRALLVMHSPVDEVVGVDNAARIYAAARHPKSFVSLDLASHLLEDPADAHYAAGIIAAWASRYVPTSDDDAAMDEAPIGPGTVVVSESGEGRFGQVARAGRHRWRADEPVSVPGAADTGPSPYDLVLAGLGACTAMTMRMYADRKGWQVGAIRVTLRQDRIHAEDCETCAGEATGVAAGEATGVAGAPAAAGSEAAPSTMDAIIREVAIEGDLDDERRARLLEIAERCPVHRTLSHGIHIITRGSD